MKIRMRYKLVTMLWMLACMLCAGGCQRDETMPDSSDTAVNLGLNLGTYALGDDDTNALPHEKQIRSLYVFIYNADGKLENPGNTKVIAADGGSLIDATGRINTTWKVYVGQKTIYVMANVPEKLKTIIGGTPAADVLNAPTLAVLQELCTDGDSFYSDYYENQSSSWKGGLMCGSVSMKVTKTVKNAAVPLTRRYARIDLSVKGSAELASATVKVTGIQWQNFCLDARLLALASEWRSTTEFGRPYVVTGLSTPLTTTDYTRVRPKTEAGEYEIYIMPLPLSGVDPIPVSIDLVVSINGKQETHTIYLAETAADGTQDTKKPLAIQANKIYKVNATLTRHSSDVEVTIEDWNDRKIKGDIAGTYLSSSQTKVRMDWWTLGKQFKATVNFTSDGTVSFVGYVTKDIAGKETVTKDGSNLPTWLPKANITGLPTSSARSGDISLTYVPTTDSHPDVTLRLKTGNITKDIMVVYDNGLIPESVLPAEWTLNRPKDGLQMAKRGNVLPFGVADANGDKEVMQWSTTQTWVPGAEQDGYGYGASNTTAIITALGAGATAANKCRSLGADWYFSSKDELNVIYNSQSYLSGSYGLSGVSAYWTATQLDISTSWCETYRANKTKFKTETTNVRCVHSIADSFTLSPTTLAADYAAWGNRFSTDVAFQSTAGAVSVQSIDNSGASKNWLTSAVVSGGTSGKITVTYAPTNNATHDDVAITLKTAGGATKTLTVKYDNGLIPSSALQTAGWNVNLPVDGIQSAKKGNVSPSGVADANWDNELMKWSTTETSVSGAQQAGYGYGASNTTEMITALGDGATAANKCRLLGEDWYFSSKNELSAIYDTKSYLGASYTFDAGSYWSATEEGTYASWCLNFNDGSASTGTKTSNFHVRCVHSIAKHFTLSATTLTADYAWGDSFSQTVDFESTGGKVSVVSIDNSGASKNWLTSAVVSGGTSGEITVTYAPTSNATHDDVVIKLKTASGITKTIKVKYDNGLIPVSALPAEWTENRPEVGLQMAKKGNVYPLGVADPNWITEEWMQFATIDTLVKAAYSTMYGRGYFNTTAMITALGAEATAANKCRSLGGFWYISSQNELSVIYNTQSYLGASYRFASYFYWSSTEYIYDAMWCVNFNDGSGGPFSKAGKQYLRCVRNY